LLAAGLDPSHEAKLATAREMLSEENSFKLVAELIERGARIVISQHPGCAQKIEIDAPIYTWRHLTENFFCKLKEFKRIDMRTCKTDRSFEVMIYLAAGVINPRGTPTSPSLD
jgi:hypothetical protein